MKTTGQMTGFLSQLPGIARAFALVSAPKCSAVSVAKLPEGKTQLKIVWITPDRTCVILYPREGTTFYRALTSSLKHQATINKPLTYSSAALVVNQRCAPAVAGNPRTYYLQLPDQCPQEDGLDFQRNLFIIEALLYEP